MPCEQFEVAFQALSQWLADCAVLPIESSVGGSIHAVYDLLLKCALPPSSAPDVRQRRCCAAVASCPAGCVRVSGPASDCEVVFQMQQPGTVSEHIPCCGFA